MGKDGIRGSQGPPGPQGDRGETGPKGMPTAVELYGDPGESGEPGTLVYSVLYECSRAVRNCPVSLFSFQSGSAFNPQQMLSSVFLRVLFWVPFSIYTSLL